MNLLLAFGGGVLSFFSPCFLPLVPAYLAYITELSFEEMKNVRRVAAIHSLLFIAGFTVIFTLLGLSASLIGQLLIEYSRILTIAGSILIIVLGLILMDAIKLPFLQVEKRIKLAAKPSGYFGSLLVGMIFAFGWSPCIGPILAGILFYASQSDTIGQGALMLVAFSLGLGLPLFLVSLVLESSLSLIKKIGKYLPVIHFICGLFLVVIGLLMLSNYLPSLSGWLMDLTGYKGI